MCDSELLDQAERYYGADLLELLEFIVWLLGIDPEWYGYGYTTLWIGPISWPADE